MWKKTIIMCLLIILVFTACSSHSNFELRGEVDEVKISVFQEFSTLNEDYHIFFEDKESIKIFVDAIENSSPISGVVDMPKGDYDLLLSFNGGDSEGFHLWISETHPTGVIMKIEDTTTAYELTESSRSEILSLLSK